MHHDVYELRKFYYTRALGCVVQRILRDRLTALWPPEQSQAMTVVGYGFAGAPAAALSDAGAPGQRADAGVAGGDGLGPPACPIVPSCARKPSGRWIPAASTGWFSCTRLRPPIIRPF